ncbi:MAG: polysaccharide biosynthesis/export family protein [Planctomycetota bacterium]
MTPDTSTSTTPASASRRSRSLLAACGLAMAAMGGCANVDSYFDPSVLGRWEYTPTAVPVLEYISSIEGRPEELVEYSPVVAGDLIPSAADYRVGPGDRIQFKIWDLVEQGKPEIYDRTVDIRGLVDIPQLGRFFVSGRNVPAIRELLNDRLKAFTANPLVEIDVVEYGQQRYSLIGAISKPGPYFIPRPDYRVLEAISSGERIDTTAKELYVIRIVPLDSALDNPTGTPPSDAAATPNAASGPGEAPAKKGQELLDAIKAISGEDPKKPGDSPIPEIPSPAVLAGNSGLNLSAMPAARRPQPANSSGAQPKAPPIDLPELGDDKATTVSSTPPASPWTFTNGKWVQIRPNPGTQVSNVPVPGNEPVGLDGDSRRPGDVVTQRVIRIPMDRLVAGDSTVNIIVHPGDVIRVPDPRRGVFYVGGQVRRPGSFNLPEEGRMTILRALDAAGGLDALAVPERAELVRVVGPGRQAIVSMNLRAIAEGTQPDVYLKPDDRINVGTNFWAAPLAVIRNGFRSSYGFGFILDRNFGNDVFGPPPVNTFGQ